MLSLYRYEESMQKIDPAVWGGALQPLANVEKRSRQQSVSMSS